MPRSCQGKTLFVGVCSIFNLESRTVYPPSWLLIIGIGLDKHPICGFLDQTSTHSTIRLTFSTQQILNPSLFTLLFIKSAVSCVLWARRRRQGRSWSLSTPTIHFWMFFFIWKVPAADEFNPGEPRAVSTSTLLHKRLEMSLGGAPDGEKQSRRAWLVLQRVNIFHWCLQVVIYCTIIYWLNRLMLRRVTNETALEACTSFAISPTRNGALCVWSSSSEVYPTDRMVRLGGVAGGDMLDFRGGSECKGVQTVRGVCFNN